MEWPNADTNLEGIDFSSLFDEGPEDFYFLNFGDQFPLNEASEDKLSKKRRIDREYRARQKEVKQKQEEELRTLRQENAKLQLELEVAKQNADKLKSYSTDQINDVGQCRIVFELNFPDEVAKRRLMMIASGFPGIISINMNTERKRMSLEGIDIDPLLLRDRLKKICNTKLVSFRILPKSKEKKEKKKDDAGALVQALEVDNSHFLHPCPLPLGPPSLFPQNFAEIGATSAPHFSLENAEIYDTTSAPRLSLENTEINDVTWEQFFWDSAGNYDATSAPPFRLEKAEIYDATSAPRFSLTNAKDYSAALAPRRLSLTNAENYGATSAPRRFRCKNAEFYDATSAPQRLSLTNAENYGASSPPQRFSLRNAENYGATSALRFRLVNAVTIIFVILLLLLLILPAVYYDILF